MRAFWNLPIRAQAIPKHAFRFLWTFKKYENTKK